MSRRKGQHWWWLKRQRDGSIVQAGGVEVTPKAVRKWDSEAARKLNRMDRHRAKAALRKGEG